MLWRFYRLLARSPSGQLVKSDCSPGRAGKTNFPDSCVTAECLENMQLCRRLPRARPTDRPTESKPAPLIPLAVQLINIKGVRLTVVDRLDDFLDQSGNAALPV